MNMAPNFYAALPEIFLLVMTCVIMIVDVYTRQGTKTLTYLLVQMTLIATAVLCWTTLPEKSISTFHGSFIVDAVAAHLKMAICLITLIVFVYSRHYLLEKSIQRGEFHVLGLFAVLGMMVMVSAHNLLTLYLGIELLALPTYAMVAMRRNCGKSSEAAMKYFVMGALSSAMLLYGFSILYGATGHLLLSDLAQAIPDVQSTLTLVFAFAFIAVGVGFKFGAVPFHMWVPDVYEGGPTPAAAFIGSAPKIAMFGFVLRLFVEGAPSLAPVWQQMLIIVAVLSLSIGNLMALVQNNVKRLIAFSTVAQVGFILLGLAAGGADGYAAAMFYVIAYALVAVAAFGLLMVMGRHGIEIETISDFKGLNQHHPWLAFLLLLVMFSLAGIPPLLGFDAKLMVISSLMARGWCILAIYALIMSVVAAYYYIRIVRLAYFSEAKVRQHYILARDGYWLLSANALVLLGLGMVPYFLVHWVNLF